ncbi:MAG: sulfite exporter TauE/SafE family protein, partial [Candidatus Omnitrophica bacterium]|nr:sulfite exporter TauE/SafE family protein [Candidatus Omnitrophota bacterium]
GGILGALGSKINYSITFTGYLTLFISIVMFYIGLQILNIVPNITKIGFHLPKSLSKKIHAFENNDHHLMPVALGALTFFLPCGFTQSMQLAAVASGTFLSGAGIMAAFALGTIPVLFSVGLGATYAKSEHLGFLTKIIGILIIFFAIYSLNSGLVLSGSRFSLNLSKSSTATATAIVQTSGENVQIVKMDVDWVFKPNEFRVKKGIPVRWEINGINVSGCSNEVVIPSLNLRQKIKQGLNIIEFTPEKEGVLPFSCWMGMLNGRFIVTDDSGGFSGVPAGEIEKKLSKSFPQRRCSCCSSRGENI